MRFQDSSAQRSPSWELKRRSVRLFVALFIVLTLVGIPAVAQDADNDGVADDVDNCPNTFNPDQLDGGDIVLLDSDFETGAQGWTHAGRGAGDTWHVGSTSCFNGALPSQMFVSNGNAGPSCINSSLLETSQLLGPPVALPADASPLFRRVHGKVDDPQLHFMKFVNHEPDNFMVVFGHHADTVPLSETAEKILLGPHIFKAGSLDFENFRHIPANEPANLNFQILLLRVTRTHDGLLAVLNHHASLES